MTCIAAIVENGKVYMAGDSAGISGYDLDVRDDPKVFMRGEFLIGFSSSFRMGQLLRWSLSPPEQSKGQSSYEYMVTEFIDAVRDTLKQGGNASCMNSVESAGTFLVGYRGKLYSVYTDYQVAINKLNYDAVGCGMPYAKGSLHATNGYDIPARERLKLAMQAAEQFSSGVRGPFIYKEL